MMAGSRTTLWIRADGSRESGMGHLMRTMALAEAAAQDRLAVRFVVGDDPVAPRMCLRRGFEVRVAAGPDNRAWLRAVRDGDLIVFDGYRFTSADFSLAREQRARVAAIDDLGRGHFPVDVLINPNPGRQHGYDIASHTSLLEGTSYALVRSEFRKRRRRRDGPLDTLLLTFGGSDVKNVAEPAVRAVDAAPGQFCVLMVRGPAARLGFTPRAKGIEIVNDPKDVGAVFDRGDAAISAAGNTTWELLCMGIPAALVEVADNQRGNAPSVEEAGAGIFLRDATRVEEVQAAIARFALADVRTAMSEAALDLVDGRGADRVLAALRGS